MIIDFTRPWVFLLLTLVPLFAIYSHRQPANRLTFSRTSALARLTPARSWLGRAPALMRVGTLVALTGALAGPRTGLRIIDLRGDGIAIMLILDLSSSMLAEDFHPDNRLVVAKTRLAEFVKAREHDRIGLVTFAGEALTQVPLTLDYNVVLQSLEEVDIGDLEDGTAIGTAIATAANRLRKVESESRIMILLTDGENNRGQIDPLTAARAAAAYGIKIYTIGVGTEGVAPIPVARGLLGGYQYAMLPVHIDEELLQDVADLSGGRYYRATNAAALDSIYHQIDQLETSRVEVRQYVDYTPRYLPFLMTAALLLSGEWILRASGWGRVP